MENSSALSIISDEAVQAALAADQGEDAKLDDWVNVPFTKKGDNFASFVTSILVQYTKHSQERTTSYVVKLNPCRQPMGNEIPDFTPTLFEKEGKFYLELLPELNKFMTQGGEKLLRFPQCYYVQYIEKKEMIIYEDLRSKGFKMTDRRKGMDLQHAILVIKELGRMHAASILMQNEKSINDIKSLHPFLFKDIFTDNLITKMIVPSMAYGKNMLEKVGSHDKAISWLENNILVNMVDFYKRTFSPTSKFSVICHGDCWNNNILFRYNDSGLPVEVMLLDVQVNRVASLAIDLNYFMFISLTGAVRKPNVDQLLIDYYDAFSSVIDKNIQDVPFTHEEIVQEYKSKNEYGLVQGTMVIPPICMEGEDMPDMDDINPEEFEQFMKDTQQKFVDSMDTNPICKPRFVAMYDEMLEEGLFSQAA